jgi:hypothetical protein
LAKRGCDWQNFRTFQKGPNRKNRAKPRIVIELDLDLVYLVLVLEFELVLDN